VGSRSVALERTVLALGAALLVASCASGAALEVAGLGSFYVGGAELTLDEPILETAPRTLAGGEVEIGQTYVQFVRLLRPRSPYPVLLLPGGSLSAVSYETTPDGRPGWQRDFLERGFSVAMADVGSVGRSPWAPFAAAAGPPAFRAKAFLWEVFRIGPRGSFSRDARARAAFAGTRFPVAAFDDLARQVFPRFRPPEAAERSRYRALLERACPCFLLAHSAAGPLAFRAALERPDLVRAVVLVEPSGGIGLVAGDAERMRAVPSLFIWGDNVAGDEGWRGLRDSARADFEALRAVGSPARWWDLPALGISGNSHMLMMDTNSGEIARMIALWLARTGAPRRSGALPPPDWPAPERSLRAEGE